MHESPATKDIETLALSQASAESSPTEQAQAPWWDGDDFPYNAPWWLRYPSSVFVFAAAYWAFFVWEKKAGLVLGVLLVIIGLGLVRELFFGIVLALIAGLVLWAFGSAVAALPVSAAIIIGAVIIAQAMRR